MAQTIALVDDDRNLLTGISIALEREGFKVQTYIDGETALNGLTRNPPDLAVIDIKMPRMDGEELLTRLRKKIFIPIIFLTSKDDEVDELLLNSGEFGVGGGGGDEGGDDLGSHNRFQLKIIIRITRNDLIEQRFVVMF